MEKLRSLYFNITYNTNSVHWCRAINFWSTQSISKMEPPAGSGKGQGENVS